MKKTALRGAMFAMLAAGVCLSLTPGCGVKYVMVSGYYQAELLLSGEPVDQVLAEGGLSAGHEQRLRLIGEVKTFGRSLGLAATHNYDKVARSWQRTIWNISACPPLSLAPKTWWFPIVGTVPYLGYFTDVDMNTSRVRLEAEGYEVYVRSVGAYSTLGWFRDPVLPEMLRWSEPQLANTILHELAHATLWIPGSVTFNESFASVVGNVSGDRFLVHKYGEGSVQVREAREAAGDWLLFRDLLVALTLELDSLYARTDLSEAERLEEKSRLFASLGPRVLASEIRNKPRWLQNVRTQTWNNARLAQFRAYNTGEADFLALLESEDGDVLRFIAAVRECTRGSKDPFAALRSELDRRGIARR